MYLNKTGANTPGILAPSYIKSLDGNGLLYLWLLLSNLTRELDVKHAMFHLSLDVCLVDIVWEYQGLLKFGIRELAAQILAFLLIAAF